MCHFTVISYTVIGIYRVAYIYYWDNTIKKNLNHGYLSMMLYLHVPIRPECLICKPYIIYRIALWRINTRPMLCIVHTAQYYCLIRLIGTGAYTV